MSGAVGHHSDRCSRSPGHFVPPETVSGRSYGLGMKERTNPRDLEQLLANNVCTKRWEEPAGPSAEVLGGQTDAGEESQVGQLDD